MNKDTLKKLFLSLLDIFRTDAVTGEKALRNLAYLLTLKLMEPQFQSGAIDIDNRDYYSFDFDEDLVPKLLSLTRFSNLVQEREDNLLNNINCVWEYVLSVHPSTKNIFLPNKKFDLRTNATFKKLLDKLNTIDLKNCNYDILGNAYEEVIKDIMTGKVLGQFFTQPSVKQMMIQLIQPQVFEDGTFETFCDPTMGTAGFLLTYFKHVSAVAKNKGIHLDKDFIRKEGLYGKEIDDDTFQLACSNMIVSSGLVLEQLHNGDSLRSPIDRKFRCILANPPYGLKGLDYDDIRSPIKDKYFPIKSTNAVSLFLQAIIYMLEIDGKCAVVLPNGQDLSSKTNKAMVAVREYLLKTCNLRKIIFLPLRIFDYTAIKTCVFYFEKKVEGHNILTVEKADKYKFATEFQTKSVQFYESAVSDSGDELILNFLQEVSIERLGQNCLSLDLNEYIREDNKKKMVETKLSDVTYVNLGDVCLFKNGKCLKKADIVAGEFPVIGGGTKPTGYHIKSNTEANMILCSSSGAAGYISRYATQVWASDCFSILSKSADTLDSDFLFYFLKANQEEIYKLKTGLAQPHVYSKDLANMLIPVPPLKKQKDIVESVDFLYKSFDQINEKSSAKIENLKWTIQNLVINSKFMGSFEVHTLENICEINFGTRIVKSKVEKGEYPVYGSGNPTFYTNTFNREGLNILVGRFAVSADCVRIVNEKFFLNDSGLSVKPKDEKVLNFMYLACVLTIRMNEIYDLARGPAQKNLDMSLFKKFEIHVPSLQKQQQIVLMWQQSQSMVDVLEKDLVANEKRKKYLFQCLFDFREKGGVDLQLDDEPERKRSRIFQEEKEEEEEEEELENEIIG